MYGREDAIKQRKCIGAPVGCGRQITQEEYDAWDVFTQKEYTLSAMCNECQDNFFGSEYDQ